MSYHQDLREAELAVIRAAQAYMDEWHAQNFGDIATGSLAVVRVDMVAALDELNVLRSQLDSSPAPFSEPDTSKTAAEMIAPLAGSLRRSILVELYRRRNFPVPGASDDQLERALKRAHTSVSAARNSLVDLGWIVDSGNRIDTPTGRPAKVWVLAPGAADRVVACIAGFALEET